MPTFGPGLEPSLDYYDCRYAVLREPIGFPRGSEILQDDEQAIHAFVENEIGIVAVGRAHLIPADSDGSQADHAGPDAAHCPSFSPLADTNNRPAIQIRQMGTRPESQRKGFASQVLSELEKKSAEIFQAKVGFLQARINAVPFYESQGWEIIDEPYEIKGIGLHRSMMKHIDLNQ